MNLILKICIYLFLISCIFDPADSVLSLKVPLFILCWIVFFLSKKTLNLKLPNDFFYFILTFILIPIFSIIYYLILNGFSVEFGGLNLLKSFILVLFSFLLFDKKINLLKDLSIILSLLSVIIILTYVYILINPVSFGPIYEFGLNTGIYHLGKRVYSDNLQIWSIYYVTSPMILIAIGYFFNKAYFKNNSFYFFLLILNILGMFVAGTRNNMLMSILLPMVLFVYYSKNKTLTSIISILSVSFILFYFADAINDMINLNEESNKSKLFLLSDYYDIFSNNPLYLIFGQGFGSYHFWESINRYYFTSELTYFEIFRYFGIFFGSIIIYFMFYPIIYALNNLDSYNEFNIILAYFFYLIMTFFNPLFFSSLGMLIFSIILANIYIHKYNLI